MKRETTIPEDVKEWGRIIHSPIRWPENPSSKLDSLPLSSLASRPGASVPSKKAPKGGDD